MRGSAACDELLMCWGQAVRARQIKITGYGQTRINYIVLFALWLCMLQSSHCETRLSDKFDQARILFLLSMPVSMNSPVTPQMLAVDNEVRFLTSCSIASW